ncbi:MAG: hypothetical protein KDE32_06520 [Novosphingobium sp.]|nr:hypothetical protein [Novosphingobium sp.]
MERHGTEIHVNEDEARAGSTPHIVRYVLAISLILAIAALSLIWITGALHTSDAQDNQSIEQRAAA